MGSGGACFPDKRSGLGQFYIGNMMINHGILGYPILIQNHLFMCLSVIPSKESCVWRTFGTWKTATRTGILVAVAMCVITCTVITTTPNNTVMCGMSTSMYWGLWTGMCIQDHVDIPIQLNYAIYVHGPPGLHDYCIQSVMLIKNVEEILWVIDMCCVFYSLNVCLFSIFPGTIHSPMTNSWF